MGKTLNITNGDMLNKFLLSTNAGEFLPFNEVMMQGIAINDIFSDEFIALRADELNTTIDIYKEKMMLIDVLQSTYEDYDEIILWFGQDTFCQMNLLTLLAFLEQIKYSGMVALNIIDDYSFKIIEENISVSLGIYFDLYNDILVNRSSVLAKGVITQRAIDLFFDYHSSEGFLATIVKSSPDLDKDLLLEKLIQYSNDYGISDIQAKLLISKYRK